MHKGIQSWKNLLIYSLSAFSTPLLFKTLFAPWQGDTVGEGSHLSFIEKFIFNIFSRIMGFVARVILIMIGLVFTLLMFLTFPIFLLLPINISSDFLISLGSFGSELSYGSTYILNKHSSDVMSHSSKKLFGKEKVLRMIERGLSKETNHNLLIVGETGVGKTTTISYLGRLGLSGLSFNGIRYHRVVRLNLEGLTVEDLDHSLHEASVASNVIVVIEDIHLFESIYEKLIHYLAMPHIGIIVTTDFGNYDLVLKKYPDFISKFEKVIIEPTNQEETISILKNNIKSNRVSNEEVLKEIVKLSDRYIGNQPQPLKSVLVVEELLSLGRKITIDDVRQVISDKTNMPLGALGDNEKKVLTELEGIMKKKIIGQDEAVKDVSSALRRLRAGISNPSKAAGSFLFLGPTGVGKTYTAKILAESYFGRKNAMIRFDMSEFSLPSSVNSFTEQVTSVIEEFPLSLVFFDEIEKANRQVHNLLLQVLDEGRLTRSSGREVSFKEALIIATSNAGSANIIANPGLDKKSLINILIGEDIFTPELLNRFSDVILFEPLSKENIRKVTALLLSELAGRLLTDKSITLEITDALIDKVAEAGFDPQFGARPINRAIEEIVENKIADYIISGNVGGTVKIL